MLSKWRGARGIATEAFDGALARFEAKYPKELECLSKDRGELLSFYDFPAEHWVHIRRTNPIESTFYTVRLRTKKSRNCGSRETTLAVVFKLLEADNGVPKVSRGYNRGEIQRWGTNYRSAWQESRLTLVHHI